jgi:PKD repeat protein
VNSGYINYGKTYYWHVKVGSSCAESGWSTPLKTFIFAYPHPAPDPNFIYLPTNPKTGNTVNFTNSSACYASGTCTYAWNFGDPTSGGNTSTNANSSHTYVTKTTKSYDVIQTVYDELGHCASTTSLPVVGNTGNLPNWKEVSPF